MKDSYNLGWSSWVKPVGDTSLDVDDLFTDECIQAIITINERWRKAYEDLVRRRTIGIIVNNDKV